MGRICIAKAERQMNTPGGYPLALETTRLGGVSGQKSHPDRIRGKKEAKLTLIKAEQKLNRCVNEYEQTWSNVLLFFKEAVWEKSYQQERMQLS